MADFDFWRDHSRTFLQAAYDYERREEMADADTPVKSLCTVWDGLCKNFD